MGLGTKVNDTYSSLPLSGEWGKGTKRDGSILPKQKVKIKSNPCRSISLNECYAHISLSKMNTRVDLVYMCG